jgi:hypothetical protein
MTDYETYLYRTALDSIGKSDMPATAENIRRVYQDLSWQGAWIDRDTREYSDVTAWQRTF